MFGLGFNMALSTLLQYEVMAKVFGFRLTLFLGIQSDSSQSVHLYKVRLKRCRINCGAGQAVVQTWPGALAESGLAFRGAGPGGSSGLDELQPWTDFRRLIHPHAHHYHHHHHQASPTFHHASLPDFNSRLSNLRMSASRHSSQPNRPMHPL